jgi:hypothetical protein
MVRDIGGGEAWQADATRRWLARLAEPQGQTVHVLEEQTRPSFVLAGRGNDASEPTVRIVLLDARPEVREQRLRRRGQPGLASAQMDCWAAYLRGQADALSVPVIDTSDLTVAQVADALEAELAEMGRHA